MNEGESDEFRDANAEHSRILAAYQAALETGDMAEAERLYREGEIVWHRVCKLSSDDEARTERGRATHAMVFIAAAVGLKASDEARRVYEQMPQLVRDAFDALDAESPGSMKIWL